MESKYGGTRKANRTWRWEHTPEAQQRPKLMSAIRARNVRLPFASLQCCHPRGLKVCTLPRSSSRKNVTTFASHVNSWPLVIPPKVATIAAAVRAGGPWPSSDAAAIADVVSTVPGAAATSSAAGAADFHPLPSSRYAKAPNWLMQHYTHFDPRDAHKPQPRTASLRDTVGRGRKGGASASPASALPDEPVPFGTFNGLPPVYMIHLAGLRSGAWQRRAVLRAHGWWHPQADRLAAEMMDWRGRRGYLMLSARSNVVRPVAARQLFKASLGLSKKATAATAADGRRLGTGGGSGGSPAAATVSGTELDHAVGNLVLLAALSGRVPVIPEVPCDALSGVLPLHPWKETRRRRGERRCAWVPPKACWQLEYATTLELQRATQVNATLARLMRQARNRTIEWKATARAQSTTTSAAVSGSGGSAHTLGTTGSGAAAGLQRASLRLGSVSACKASVAMGSLLNISPRSLSVAGGGSGQGRRLSPEKGLADGSAANGVSVPGRPRSERHDERVLLRTRMLPCESSHVVALEDHSTEERLRKRKLRPSPAVPRTPVNDTKGPDATIGPWSWAGVDTAQLGATLGSAEVGEWLRRDAKCIDELLKLKADPVAKGRSRAAKRASQL
jgi:hypothetical protein